MKRATLAGTLAIVTLLVMPLAAHFAVTKSLPAKDQTLTVSPKRLQIWFSEMPAAPIAEIHLATADKKEITIGKAKVDAATKSMYVDLTQPLAPGAYVMSWRGAGDDGHVQTGDVKFTVASPKTTR